MLCNDGVKKVYFKCCKITVLHDPVYSSLLTSCGRNISVGLDSCLTQTHHLTICREKPVGQLYPSSVQLLVGWQLGTDAIHTWALGTDKWYCNAAWDVKNQAADYNHQLSVSFLTVAHQLLQTFAFSLVVEKWPSEKGRQFLVNLQALCSLRKKVSTGLINILPLVASLIFIFKMTNK